MEPCNGELRLTAEPRWGERIPKLLRGLARDDALHASEPPESHLRRMPTPSRLEWSGSVLAYGRAGGHNLAVASILVARP